MRNSELNARHNSNKAPHLSERIHAPTHSRPQRHSPFSKAVLEQYENAESQHLDWRARNSPVYQIEQSTSPPKEFTLSHSRPQRHSPFSKAVLEQYGNAESQHLNGEPEIPLSVVKAARAPISEQPFDRSD
ncbi:hypothetical protein CEXT_781781 [Caerostris extrusa]|uniref:Uncharacterized protein n=1 Tax=Caerostris extrusa TaxID=172846 RepID=A0AAV4R8F6_CAEEX|nr:hypothetical protein CEXT_781781 [Caerostris extrusa]